MYSLAAVTGSCPLLLFGKTNKSLNLPKCTCYMHRCVPSEGNVAVSRVRIHWLACQDYYEQSLSWINTLGVIDSNQHDLSAGRCNVIESFSLEMARSSLPNFSTNGFEASITDVSRHRLPFLLLMIRSFILCVWRRHCAIHWRNRLY